MSSTQEYRSLWWSRGMVLPTVAILLGASVIVGYASSDLFPSRPRHSGADLQLVAYDPQGRDSSTADAGSDASEQAYDPVGNYKTALQVLKRSYYGGPIDDKKTRQLTYEAIRGMLGSLKDQFTSFLDPDDWNQMKATTQGNFEGIGALLQPDPPNSQSPKFVKIVEPIEGGPAEKAGIKADDVITKVNGRSVVGKNINEVVRSIKGPHGTKVHISIVRGKAPMEFTITRAIVEPPVVKSWMEDPQAKIGHIVLKEFNEKSVAQMDAAYNELKSQGMRGLIFDLRGNPGGLLEVALQVASKFIPQDENPELKNAVIWIHEGSGREQTRNLMAIDETYQHMPLVVLVDGNSASASEIVSGAIKDYGVGTLVGERTFGKGRVQTLYPLDDGSALRLTTQLYFPPKHHDINFQRDDDGNKIQNTGGVVPDITVKQPLKWKGINDKANDDQLKKALEVMREKLGVNTTASASKPQ